MSDQPTTDNDTDVSFDRNGWPPHGLELVWNSSEREALVFAGCTCGFAPFDQTDDSAAIEAVRLHVRLQ